jgi:hypothetical protein
MSATADRRLPAGKVFQTSSRTSFVIKKFRLKAGGPRLQHDA